MNNDDDSLGNFTGNTHRSLQGLVSVNAYFVQDVEKENRFTLHADVSFSEERLSGGPSTEITFRLAIKRCDIVFSLPNNGPFRVDPSSVHSPRPLNPKTVLQTSNTKKGGSGRATLGLSPKGLNLGGEASAKFEKEISETTSSEQTVSHYHELWKKVGSNHAWSVDGRELHEGRLAGPVFDHRNDPRLTIIDGRSHEARKRDEEQDMNPVAQVFVQCLREDLDVYDVEYKDPDKQDRFWRSPDRKAKLLAAREVLKVALLEEGLRVGDLVNDPFAEMRVCEVAITITDSGA